MSATPAALRMICAIADIEDDVVRRPGDCHGRGVRGRELAMRLWPDAPGWKQVRNCGPHGATTGAGMPRCAGSLAGKLSHLEEPLTRYLGWERGWTLTERGRHLVLEHRRGQ